MYILLVLIILCPRKPVSANEPPIYRIVHLEDLYDNRAQQTVNKQWTAPKDGLISRLATHLDSKSVFVAVNNSVIRLSIETLSKLDEVSWSLPREQSETCAKRSVKDLMSCSSYMVSLLVPVDGVFSTVTSSLLRTGLFTCITNGKTSECSLRQAADLRGPPKVHWKGSRHCPTDPLAQISATYASNRNLYVAGKFDEIPAFTSTIARITERVTEGSALSTVQFARFPSRNSWIFQDDRTQFIHSFEFHDAVYFLFREPAEELLDGCKKFMIASRVGRLCLMDDTTRSGRLQTFVKATIACPGISETSAEPSSFVHSILQSVHVDQSSKTLFAVFVTPSTMPASSVMCEYRLTELEKVFDGPFHLFRGEHTKSDNPIRCLSSDSTAPVDTNLPLDSRLMYNVIRPRTGQPILIKEGTIWKHLSVDWVPQTPKSDNNLVVFTIDSNDVLTKWHLFKSEACVIEQIHMHREAQFGTGKTVHMQLIRDQYKPILLIATTKSVFRLPVARCSRLGHDERACVLLHDPYCAWNRQTEQCQELLETSELRKQLVRYETCPSESQDQTDVIVHGAWGAWGPWSPCQMSHNRSLHARRPTSLEFSRPSKAWDLADPLVVNGCQCRYRYCSAPYRFGIDAQACPSEYAIQVANCSTDGRWTSWSSWSGCEPACSPHRKYGRRQEVSKNGRFGNEEDSYPIRTRQRWCTNPSPMGEQGKNCPGLGKELQTCPKSEVTCTTEPLVIPKWSRWSEWNACSAVCNGGVQLRWRKCSRNDGIENFQPAALNTNNVLPRENFEGCLGEAYESRACNTHTCPVTKVTSSWTAWYIMEGNRQKGTRERRYRVECVATVPEVDKLQARIQLQSGSCRTDSAGTVICQGIYPSPTIEISQPEWSSRSDHAWSAWTGCSRPCGGGMRSRWRLRGQPSAASLSAVGSNDIGAPEAEREEQSCNTHPCPGRWSCWTAWSKCTHPPCSMQRGEQRRFRSCLISSSVHLVHGQQPTVDQCDGGEEHSVQSRPCEITFDELQCQPSSITTKFDMKKRTIPDEPGAQLDSNMNLRTPWADWSECFPVDGLAYEIRVRAREQCDACELVQVKRCDTQDSVSIDEILHQAPHLRGAKPAGQDTHEPGKYGLVYAIIAGLCGAALGIAVVLIPYLIYVNRTRKQATKRGRQEQRSSVWRKLNERRLNSERNMPYIWFADTDRSEKAAVKQMLLQRKKANNSLEAATVGPSVERAKTGASRPKETIGDSPSTLQTQASAARPGPHRNASLTRIQALHNDHRGTIKNRNISPLSMNEPIVPWEHTTTERNGLNPAFVDSSPPQPHVDHGRVFNKSPISTYDPTAETVNTITKCPSLFHAQGAVANNPNTQKDEIIYASA